MRLLFILIALTTFSTHAQALRIISLAPHITEMVYSAGAGEQLVGVVVYSDYPPAAKKLPIIGSYTGINIEEIIKLKPDLVLGWKEGNAFKDLARLKTLGIEVWHSDVKTLNDIPKHIREIAKKTGTEQHAQTVTAELETILSSLQATHHDVKTIRSFYQIWQKPLITVNGKQFISQAIELCGGENIFYDALQLSPQVSLESVIARNPAIILMGGPINFQQEWKKNWQKFTFIDAVKNQQIIVLNPDLYQRPTERFIRELPNLCKILDKARSKY